MTLIHAFQHTAARRRLATDGTAIFILDGFNTQPPEGGCGFNALPNGFAKVSTHSRPKAAERLEPV